MCVEKRVIVSEGRLMPSFLTLLFVRKTVV